MKRISSLEMMRSRLVIAVTPILLAAHGAVHATDKPILPLDAGESVQTTKQGAQHALAQPNKAPENFDGPLEYEIDPERVKRNQEVLDELYRNVYRYDSGVFNYEKKIN